MEENAYNVCLFAAVCSKCTRQEVAGICWRVVVGCWRATSMRPPAESSNKQKPKQSNQNVIPKRPNQTKLEPVSPKEKEELEGKFVWYIGIGRVG